MGDIVNKLQEWESEGRYRGNADLYETICAAAAEIKRLRRHLSLMQGHDTLAVFEATMDEQKDEIERLRRNLVEAEMRAQSWKQAATVEREE